MQQDTGTNDVITKGLNYAKERGWDTFEKGLKGGAEVIKKYYIGNRQDTKYFMKFNVLNNSIYHQYMQNITAPIAEGKSLKNAYAKHDPNLEGEYLFKIPLFYDMPSNDTPSPDNDDKYNATVIISEGVRVRADSTRNSDKVKVLSFGQMFEAFEKVENSKDPEFVWYRVRVGNQYGYIPYYRTSNPSNKFFEIKNIANTTEVEGEQGKTENPNKPKTEENSKYQYIEDKDVTYPIYGVVNVQSVLRFRDNLGISGTNVIGTIENDKIIKVVEKSGEKDRICMV